MTAAADFVAWTAELDAFRAAELVAGNLTPLADPATWTPLADVYAAYQAWAWQAGIPAPYVLTAPQVARGLVDNGHTYCTDRQAVRARLTSTPGPSGTGARPTKENHR